MHHWLLLLSGNRRIFKFLLSSHHFYWKGRTNLNVKSFGWVKLIFVDLKWNKCRSLRKFQRNFKLCNYLYWMSMRNNEQWTAFRCRSVLITMKYPSRVRSIVCRYSRYGGIKYKRRYMTLRLNFLWFRA